MSTNANQNQSTEKNDVRTMYIGDRIRHHARMGGLTGELFGLAADEIERLQRELASARVALDNCTAALRGSYDARG